MDARKNRSSIMRIAACWIALAAMMLCNWLFEYLRLGGVTTAEVSNQVFAWFTPAGYVFAIWGVIYAALAVWMVMESGRAAQGRSLDARQTGLFVLSCALNVGWLVAFHFQQVAIALVVVMALSLTLGWLYIGLRDDETRTRFGLIPFSLYFAWSTVAVIANATNLAMRMVPTTLIANQVTTVVLTVALIAVAVLSVRNSRDYVFPLVVLWALAGVGVRLMSVDMPIATAVLVITTLGALAIYLPPLIRANDAPRRSRVPQSR